MAKCFMCMSKVTNLKVVLQVARVCHRCPGHCPPDPNTYCGSKFDDISESEMTQEQGLLYRLMRGYDKASRPVFEAANPVVVRLGITLTQVLDMDEKNQILTTNVWLDQEWIDERLIWDNITEYASITILRIPCDFLWLPDIVLYNNVDNHNAGYMKSLAMVQSNGNVFWPPIVRMRSSCKIDITYFPFDDQICKMKMGSWAYDGFQVDVINRSVDIDLSNFVDNGEWTLVGTRVRRNVIYYSCCPEPFPDVTFYIHLRRRVLFYFFNVIIPCMLLSTLTLTGFCLPPDSGEKITLGLTVLLAFSVFMLLIAENMPPTSEYVPLIGIYLTLIMGMSALSVVFSVFVLNFHHRGSFTRGPPCWMITITRLVAKILCSNIRLSMDTPTQIPCPTNLSGKGSHGLVITASTSVTQDTCNKSLHQRTEARPCHVETMTNGYTNNNSGMEGVRIEQDCGESINDELVKCIQAVVAGQRRTIEEENAVSDWQQVARMLDSVFFCVFLFVTVTSSIYLLVISPMTKDVSIDSYL